MGLSPAGLNGIPAEDPAKDEAARSDGRAGHGPGPARHPAVADRQPGGARERHRLGRRDRRLDQRRPAPPGDRPRVRDRRSTSTSSARSPTGRRSSPTCSPAAASRPPTCTTPAAWPWSCASCSSATCSTATRRPSTAGRSPRSGAAAVETPGQTVVVPIERPLKPTGGLAILHGSLAPDGCVVKLAGHERRLHRGPARVFDSETACYDAVRRPADPARRRGRDPLRGTGRRPGHAGDAERHRRARRRRPGRHGGAADRRPLQGRHPRPDDRPRRPRGRPGRPDRARPGRRPGRDRRRPERLDLDVAADELERRRASWAPPRAELSAAGSWPSTPRWSARHRKAP